VSTELTTRRPTGKPSWPIVLIAGAEKVGKTYAAATFSGSGLIDRTFWMEVGEGSADLYGALPGARYEIVEHDGSFVGLGRMAKLASGVPAEDGKPHALVIDNMTAVWDLLADEQQVLANERAAKKGRRTDGDAQITMDQWNAAKKRWGRLLEVLRQHEGPVILIARLEQVAVVGPDGKPTTDKTWKIRTEKNLPYEVDVIVEMPRPREAYLTGVRSLALQVPPGAHAPRPNFTIEGLLRDMGFGEVETAPRNYVTPDSAAYAASLEGQHAALRGEVYEQEPPAKRSKPKAPQADEWTTPAAPSGATAPAAEGEVPSS
jgi:AAA domain